MTTLAAYAARTDAAASCRGRTDQGDHPCESLCPRCTPPGYRIDPAANIAAELDDAMTMLDHGMPSSARAILAELRAALLA